MDEGKIIIANLAKGKIGEDNCSLLGALVVTKIQLAALSRADQPEDERMPFYLSWTRFIASLPFPLPISYLRQENTA